MSLHLQESVVSACASFSCRNNICAVFLRSLNHTFRCINKDYFKGRVLKQFSFRGQANYPVFYQCFFYPPKSIFRSFFRSSELSGRALSSIWIKARSEAGQFSGWRMRTLRVHAGEYFQAAHSSPHCDFEGHLFCLRHLSRPIFSLDPLSLQSRCTICSTSLVCFLLGLILHFLSQCCCLCCTLVLTLIHSCNKICQ